MSKYAIAREALGQAVKAGAEAGFDRTEMLLTMIISAVSDYKEAAGKKAARDALSYELSELAGAIDTQFIRSR
jgi:hypothetical protein